MPKNNLNITDQIMTKLQDPKIRMVPRWHFIVGSISLVVATFSSFVFSVYLVSLISFSLRTHGPMGDLRFAQLVTNFPVWSGILAVLGSILGIKLLQKFDFSYRRNFVVIAIMFIVSIILAGILVDFLKTYFRPRWGRQYYPKGYIMYTQTDRR